LTAGIDEIVQKVWTDPRTRRPHICHGENEETTYRQLCVLMREEVEKLRQAGKELPVSGTRAMREAVLA
jgi:hypothetical protein